MSKVAILFVFLGLGGCSHDGHLVTNEKDAWISVESGSRTTLYYCTARITEEPVCYMPKYFVPTTSPK